MVVIAEIENHVGYITLNRPDAYNALSTNLMELLKEELELFESNDDVHCIVLKANGEHFSTGADIKEFGQQTQNNEAIEYRAKLTKSIHQQIPSLKKVIISSVKGYTLAGGCGIALACDLVIAAENTMFSYPEINRGFVPAIVTPNLTKISHRKKAFEMLITGDRYSAKDLLVAGMINTVVAPDKLEEETKKLAEKIASHKPQSLAMTKSLFYEATDMNLIQGIEYAKDFNIKMRKSDEFKQGVQQFLERK
ncbi:enoyl-CoA hydratase/isomerase family protein [Solibacillus sp. FSL W8-0474]|uniref:enoyl-CoA hydratase/isomerase family protein n=1 Tax=Solibacillus sp. FSL W8-0474 TaxID=2975336 RepID=UPI0030F665F2